MLYFNRIDVLAGVDINKTSASKEYDICYYWYYQIRSFKFQPNVCSGCHDVFMMFMNLSDIAILNISGANYGCIILRISKSKAINLMQNIDLSEKIGTL